MEIDKEKLKELAEEYEFSLNYISKLANLLMTYDCVKEGADDQFYECLELLIQDRLSAGTVKQSIYDDPKSLDYSLSDALYRVYDEKAIPNLSIDYIEINKSRYKL